MRTALREIDWQTMLTGKTIDEMWTYFKRTLQTLRTSYVPRKNFNQKEENLDD